MCIYIYIYILFICIYKHLIYNGLPCHMAILQLKKKPGFFSPPKTKPGIGQVAPSTLQCRWLDVVHQRHHYQDPSEPPVVMVVISAKFDPEARTPTYLQGNEGDQIIQATKKWPQKVTVLVEMIPPKHKFEAKRWKSKLLPKARMDAFLFSVYGEKCAPSATFKTCSLRFFFGSFRPQRPWFQVLQDAKSASEPARRDQHVSWDEKPNLKGLS